MKMNIKRIAPALVLASTLGLGIGSAVADSYYNTWNAAQGALQELDNNTAIYGTSYYNDTIETRNALDRMAEEAYNATRSWNN
jgi:hypothetical protein